MTKRTLLIDGDVLAYKIAATIERPIHWGNDLWTLHSDAAEGKRAIDEQLITLQEDLNADDVIIALTSSDDNFRFSVWPSYKSNRKGKRKPLCLYEMRNYMLEAYDTFLRPGLEGDDVMGILATHPTLVKGEKVIVSIDKDMKTIPGRVYNDGRPEEGIATIPEGLADYWFMYQTITGDTTDGYPGLPSFGPKKAEALLGDPEAWASGELDIPTMWPLVVEAYEKKGLTEDDAIIQARCARILRHTDYDFKKKEVILWTPPS